MLDVPTETEEAYALVEWVSHHAAIKDYFIHIPNEGPRTMRYGKSLRLMGLKRGVSDYLIAYPVAPYHGLWLELKRRSAFGLAAAQKEWIERMLGVGYAAYVVYGWEEAKDAITAYLKGRQWTSTR